MAQPVDNLALFDAPPKAEKAKRKTPKPPAAPGAHTVVAAYVDSYRAAHGGETPIKPHISRVGRDAKGILERGEAGPEELAAAATEMGQGIYHNLGMALVKHREKKRPPASGARQGMAPASEHTHPYWQESARRNESAWYQRLLTDDDTVAWVREDPAAVEEILRKWPELEERLRGAA